MVIAVVVLVNKTEERRRQENRVTGTSMAQTNNNKNQDSKESMVRVPAHAKDAAVRQFFRRWNDVKVKESQFLLRRHQC